MENRALATVPKDVNIKNIFSGQWTKEIETYISDQFPARDFWLKSYVLMQLALNKTYMSDEYYADQSTGYIISKPKEGKTDKEIKKYAEQIIILYNELKKLDIPLTFFLLPSKASYVRDPHPDFMPEDQGLGDANLFLSILQKNGVDQVQLMGKMLEISDSSITDIRKLFFKTDHHWNMRGAFLGYQAIIEELAVRMGKEANLLNDNNTNSFCLDLPFAGSWNRHYYLLIENDDKVCYIEPASFEIQFTTFIGGVSKENEKDRNEVYRRVLHDNKAKTVSYATGYSSDYGEMNILNKDYDWDMHLLVLKDSYFNAIQYHVANHFKQTTIIDLRHFDENLLDYIKKINPDYIIMTYNDRNLDYKMAE